MKRLISIVALIMMFVFNVTTEAAGKTTVMLHFDESTTRDECGNSWSAYNNPALDDFGAISGKALQLNHSYLKLNNPITLGGQDFTIDFWMNLSSHSGSWARAFVFYNNDASNRNAILLYRYGSANSIYSMWNDYAIDNKSAILDQFSHVAMVYQHNLKKLKTYINGRLTSERDFTIPRTTFTKGFIGKSNFPNEGDATVGTIDEFRVTDGVALWTSNFNPPATQSYTQPQPNIPQQPQINNLSNSSFTSALRFNEYINYDESGNEWKVIGNPILSSNQYISGGKSLYLDGNSCLKATTAAPFDFPEEFTMEAWIYPVAWVTDAYGDSFSIFSRWLHGVRTLYMVNIDNGHLSFYSDFAGRVNVVSSSTVPLNRWTHIAVTRDSKNIGCSSTEILKPRE